MPTGEPFQSSCFYESLILSHVESCSEEDPAALELLKSVFPRWCAGAAAKGGIRQFGWSLLQKLALPSR